MIMEKKFGILEFVGEESRMIKNVWLIITESEIILETPHEFKLDQWDIILGQFVGLSKVTFIHCFVGGGSGGSGSSFRKIHVSWMIKNIHIARIEEVVFNTISLTSPALNQWINTSYSLDYSNDYKNVSIPEPLTILKYTNENFDLEIKQYFSSSYSRKQVILNRETGITIKFNKAEELKFIIGQVNYLRDLILFLTEQDPQFELESLDNFYELIILRPNLNSINLRTGVSLNYGDLEDHLPSIIAYWFEKGKLKPIIELILEKYYNQALIIPRFFLNVSVALESFHSNFIAKKIELSDSLPMINRDKILKHLINDQELYDWFRQETSYWKNPNLVDRLFAVQDLIAQIIGDSFQYDVKSFIRKVKNTRNKLAHQGIYDSEFKTFVELLMATKTIELTVRLLILKNMGVNIQDEDQPLICLANNTINYIAHNS